MAHRKFVNVIKSLPLYTQLGVLAVAFVLAALCNFIISDNY